MSVTQSSGSDADSFLKTQFPLNVLLGHHVNDSTIVQPGAHEMMYVSILFFVASKSTFKQVQGIFKLIALQRETD